MSLYHIVKTSYRWLFPKSIRRTIFSATPLVLKEIKMRLIRALERSAKHDEIYDADYFAEIITPYMAKSCDTIAESIIDAFSPKSLVDVGCGNGLLLSALKRRGISCRGAEYSKAAIDACRLQGLDVIKFDLEHNMLPKHFQTSDVVTSTEVAEHLPEACADRFVDVLCAIADTVVLTAAEPLSHSFGTDHVNEQPKEYWIEKFESRGFKYNQDLSMRWRKHWKDRDVARFLCDTVMVFHKRE